MAAEDAAKCITCGIVYRTRDAGFLGCRAHTMSLNQDTGHFRCCGAAPHDSSCIIHAESIRSDPSGCHRMDHCGTVGERWRILNERPYAIAPLNQAIADMPYAKEDDGVRVFHVTREEQLENAMGFYVPVPKNWQGSGLIRGGTIRVDLHAEHDTLRKALIEREYETVNASADDIAAANDLSDPYASEWVRHTTGVHDVSTPIFVPFAVVMRIDTRRDADVGGKSVPCVWRD